MSETEQAHTRAWRRNQAPTHCRHKRREALRRNARKPPTHMEAELPSGRLRRRVLSRGVIQALTLSAKSRVSEPGH